jgi:DNA-directed RNA polymerase subunit RPC12/RpoP
LADNSEENKQIYPKSRWGNDACPNCGHELSPWQQVLLKVDRALVCKNCWHRIILDISEVQQNPLPAKEKE